MATARKPPTPGRASDEDSSILDLRELVTETQAVLLPSGTYQMRKLGSLSPLERERITEAQRAAERAQTRAEEIGEDSSVDDVVEFMRMESDSEDIILSIALPELERADRDGLSGYERAAVIAAFFGMPAEMAKSAGLQRAHMDAFTTGATPSRASSASTAGRRRSS
ncbi:MAG: hypothetical protein RIB67_07470 [Miltoncostaeaceae bacterium]